MTRNANRLLLATTVILLAGQARADNICDQPGDWPDATVGDIDSVARWGTVNGVTAYSIGTDTCNVGTCQLNWIGSTNEHPVIGQNLFRLRNGRFEQIGQSWVKHVQVAAQGSVCGTCSPASGGHLGVNCSDPYGSGLNGSQTSLGPKFEIQPATGVHPHPFTAQGVTGNSIYKRLQVANTDLDPGLNLAARYYVEAQLVARDDTAGGHGFNNASYRPVTVTSTGTDFNLSLSGSTMREQPAIRVWGALDPTVQTVEIASQYVGAVKVTQVGSLWHYEYALQNLISSDAVQSFRVPIPHGALVTNIGFHDIPYHSGEPYSGTDWTATIDTNSDPPALVWSTETFAENPNANALRWGTLYNFRFDVDAPPVAGNVSLIAFQPGGTNLLWGSLTPNRCGDGTCDANEDNVGCVADCSLSDGAGSIGGSLQVSRLLDGQLQLDWTASCSVTDDDYAVYEGDGSGFTSHVSRLCSTGGSTTGTIMPGNAPLTYYIVVPKHGAHEGSYGHRGDGSERPQAVVPCSARVLVSCGP